MRHRHVLLRLLKLRIVVNDHDIYEFKEKVPVLISCSQPVTKLIVTNGFHFSRVVTIKCNSGIHFYEVESLIDNIQLLTGLFLTVMFFTIFILTGIRFFMFFANLPILIMLYMFYIKRRDFMQVHVLLPEKKKTVS